MRRCQIGCGVGGTMKVSFGVHLEHVQEALRQAQARIPEWSRLGQIL